MIRFRGELNASPRVALVTSDALGNFVVVTPWLQMFRAKFPNAYLCYLSGPRTQEFWEVEPSIDCGIPVQSSPDAHYESVARQLGIFDLVVNLEASEWACRLAGVLSGPETFVVGPAMDRDRRTMLPFDDVRGALWEDSDWTSPDLTARYPFLDSPFIGAIFARLAYLDGPVPAYRLSRCDPPTVPAEVLISTAASLPEKLWPAEKWLGVAEHIASKGLTMAVLGADPAAQGKYWQGGQIESMLVEMGHARDLRGILSLPEVVGAIGLAKRVVTIDNGVLHMACATCTRTVGLFRPGFPRLWAPPVSSILALEPEQHGSVSDIPVDEVLQALAV